MCDITQLQADACSNGFVGASQNEALYRALVAQFLCIGLVPPEPQGGILGEGGQPIIGENGGGVLFI